METDTSRTFGLYTRLLHGTEESVYDAEERFKMLTGIEIHTCWQTYAGTDALLKLRIKSGHR